ncbi:fasciclin domain-containing protein [Muricauda sp. JGD-17]|uniref:Fasciclin domain-containing protein n=1 Tax=Flagellimonas ochracea TaxID=2696472 RepID=A0A964TC25_9FLAO|nr:fasciclin domain-containing protein [Allomuricauda ochracea]NAY90751.1 fasciclin domain-containing protein [Allomuricauda ochracea]
MRTPLTKFLVFLCLISFAFLNAQSLTATIAAPVQSSLSENNHKILLAAVKAAQLDSILIKSGPFTVFAPSDAAFERFSNTRIEELINAQDKSELKSLLKYHIVAGHLTASRILRAMCRGNGKASFTTIQGKKVIAHMEGYDIVLTDPTGNTARITAADRNLENGIIHEIDSVIQPTRM